MREKSNYPNRKHTADSLREELNAAYRAGLENEIADLSLLIQNAERPKGAPLMAGVDRARNRQAQRRYHREKLPANVDYNAPGRRVPKITDWVECPGGERWRVVRVTADTCWGGEFISCPTKLLTIVSGPHPTPVVAAPVACTTCGIAEALYQGVWDAYEVQDWALLERALRAYEASLAELGM